MNNEPLLLELFLLEVDYCKPIENGALIYMSGQSIRGKPVGLWKKFDNQGNIINIFDGKDLSIYKHYK